MFFLPLDISISRGLAARVRLIDPVLPSLRQLGRPRCSSNAEDERGERGSARSPRRRRRRRRDVGAVRRRVGRGAPGRRSARCQPSAPTFLGFRAHPNSDPRRPPPKTRHGDDQNLSVRDDNRRRSRRIVVHPLIVPRSAGDRSAPNASYSREREKPTLLSGPFSLPSSLRLLHDSSASERGETRSSELCV